MLSAFAIGEHCTFEHLQEILVGFSRSKSFQALPQEYQARMDLIRREFLSKLEALEQDAVQELISKATPPDAWELEVLRSKGLMKAIQEYRYRTGASMKVAKAVLEKHQ